MSRFRVSAMTRRKVCERRGQRRRQRVVREDQLLESRRRGCRGGRAVAAVAVVGLVAARELLVLEFEDFAPDARKHRVSSSGLVARARELARGGSALARVERAVAAEELVLEPVRVSRRREAISCYRN